MMRLIGKNGALGIQWSLVLLVGLLCGLCNRDQEIGYAQEGAKLPKPPIEEFEKYLSNSVLSGSFTMDGQPLSKLEEERYEIKSAKKLPGDDNLWEIKTRIKYGNKDLTVPVVVNLEWVGRTPMIVLDSVTIPGLGTFSARVVFHDRKYAGTWKHDNVGGHLFGRVEPTSDSAK